MQPTPEPTLIPLPADDPATPNNVLPLILYRGALDVGGADPASVLEARFSGNGWTSLWRNGVFDFEHYHSTAHEVLGVAAGSARVRFGGAKGHTLDLAPGDVVVLPAGTGHCRTACTETFLAVGGYPPGPSCDLIRTAGRVDAEVKRRIAAVPVPAADPVLGKGAGVAKVWIPTRNT